MSALLRYTLDVPNPRDHHFHVTLTLDDAGPVTHVMMPRWTPGSYLLREHGRHVVNLRATRGGQAATVHKADPHTWEIRSTGSGPLTLSYQVYAHELTVRTAHVDDTHAFFNGVCVFLLPLASEFLPCTVDMRAPAGWKIATTLPHQGGNTYTATDYHHLVDCPVEMGTHRSFTFEVRGVPHEFVLWNHGNENLEKLQQDIPKLVETNARVFGGLPYERYLFITHLTESTRGGLEHRDSTALIFPRFSLKADKDYEDFLALVEHEHFHTWNVKRIKPRQYAAYDYTQENSTRLLWALEGFTSYFDNLGVKRSGLMTADRYLTVLGELITQLHNTPGRLVQSVEEAATDAWVRYYRQDENTAHSTISYYLKGELSGLCLDMSLRHGTQGARSMDDVMRTLWAWTQKQGEGLPDDAWYRAFSEVAGRDMTAELDALIRTTQELPLAQALEKAGLKLQWRAAEGAEDKGGTPGKGGPARPWWGAAVRKDGTVLVVKPGGPSQHAGLSSGDQVVAVNGFRANEGGWAARLEECTVGQQVTVHFFRRDELRTTTLTLAEAPATYAFITKHDDATPAQLALRKAWLQDG